MSLLNIDKCECGCHSFGLGLTHNNTWGVLENRPIHDSSTAIIKQRTYTSEDVARHCSLGDCWVSLLGNVYDMTKILQDFKGSSQLIEPIIHYAGRDVSHWFDKYTREVVRSHVCSTKLRRLPYVEDGEFVQAFENKDQAWWNEKKYIIGCLTARERKIIILNMLTKQEHILQVCKEDTINDICKRYLSYNTHAASYLWKYKGRELDMTLTLEENGIADEVDTFYKLKMNEDAYIPKMYLYFKDDLTEL